MFDFAKTKLDHIGRTTYNTIIGAECVIKINIHKP